MSFREARAKRRRIMVELTPADHEALKRWLASAGSADETTLAEAVSAMIRATAADHVVNDAVLALIRAGQS
jgi:DNA-binding MarR family transcriptional regulator